MNFRGIHIEVVDADIWARDFSENAHKAVFDKGKPAHWDRIDYALLMANESPNKVVGYITCREIDHETVYWQFGGSTPDFRASMTALRAFQAALEWAKLHYKRVTFRVENTNSAMLKMAQKENFIIIGVRTYGGSVLLEHVKEFKEAA